MTIKTLLTFEKRFKNWIRTIGGLKADFLKHIFRCFGAIPVASFNSASERILD